MAVFSIHKNILNILLINLYIYKSYCHCSLMLLFTLLYVTCLDFICIYCKLLQ